LHSRKLEGVANTSSLNEKCWDTMIEATNQGQLLVLNHPPKGRSKNHQSKERVKI